MTNQHTQNYRKDLGALLLGQRLDAKAFMQAVMIESAKQIKREKARQRLLNSWRQPGPRRLVAFDPGRAPALPIAFEDHAALKRAAKKQGLSIGKVRRTLRRAA